MVSRHIYASVINFAVEKKNSKQENKFLVEAQTEKYFSKDYC